jgi:hypothetical protein
MGWLSAESGDFREEIQLEKFRRQRALEAHYNPPKPPPVAAPTRPAITQADVDKAIKELGAAIVKVFKTGDTDDELGKVFKTYCDQERYPSWLPRGLTILCVKELWHQAYAINEKNKERNRRIDELEMRIKFLEAQPTDKGLHYEGVWSGLTNYAKNAAVTHGGSLWIAKSANVSCRPGHGDGPWQLAVKRGSDGRDGKDAQ